MTMATLSHVHTSPRKPCASAPRSRSSGTLARCSSLRRGRAPGAGRRFRACAPPPSRARFIHWLTAPLLTPRASAIRCWDHPCCLSSKALKRLPSRQSVASLESELSMRRSYHRRLATSAEISRSRGAWHPFGDGQASGEQTRLLVLLPRRWVVERDFAWASRFRRLVKDYERLAATLAGLHFVAIACLFLRQAIAVFGVGP